MAVTNSPQMQKLLDRYGVTRVRDLQRAIRDELNAECFDPADTDLRWSEARNNFVVVPARRFTLLDAVPVLDRMLEAEYQRIEGGAYDEIDREARALGSDGLF